MARGRKPITDDEQVEYQIHLRLWRKQHPDLIAWLESIPDGQRTLAVIMALEAGGVQQVTEKDLTAQDMADLNELAGNLLA